MNKERRKRLAAAVSKLEEVKESMEALCEEEQDAYDNLPESLQDSERGEQMSDCIDALGEAVSDLEGIIDTLNDYTA